MKKSKSITLYFDEGKELELSTLEMLSDIKGVYFISCKSLEIQYPFQKSHLIYIGMSEKKASGIKKRLTSHYGGAQNAGLKNYRKVDTLLYTYLNAEALEEVWELTSADLESYFLRSFVKHFGVYPICNTRTGYEILEAELPYTFNVDWNYFK